MSAHLKKTSLTISGDLSRWQVSDVESPHGQIKLRSLSVSVEHPISRDLNLFGGAQLLLFSNELGSDGLPVLSLGLYR